MGEKKKKKKRELTEIIFLNIWMDLGFPLLRLTEVQGWVCVPDPEEHHTVTAVCKVSLAGHDLHYQQCEPFHHKPVLTTVYKMKKEKVHALAVAVHWL